MITTADRDDLTWLPAWRLRELIGSRELSAVELSEHLLSRIDEHDGALHAFAAIDRAAVRSQAKRAERAQLRDEELGPLHAIPISVKEHIPVKGLPTVSPDGSTRVIASDDHPGIERLREAGAVIVGMNTMFGAGAADGHLDREREARNPWDLNRTPGASSAGGAAAAAARLVPLAIGSDGAGSTRLPPAYCGVTGIHTSRGRIPHVDYVNPALALTSSIGPIARDVRDVAQALRVMAGPDGRDFACMEDEPDDYVAATDRGVEGLRFAWTPDFGFAKAYTVAETPSVVAAIRSAVEEYRSLGARVDDAELSLDDPWPHFEVTNRVVYRPWPALRVESDPTPEDYRRALAVRARSVELTRGLLVDHDLLLSPTTHSIAPTLEECEPTGLRPGEGGPTPAHYLSLNVLFNWFGWLALSVPCGFLDGLPIGLQIAGPPGSEGLLLRAARAMETLHPAERPPIA